MALAMPNTMQPVLQRQTPSYNNSASSTPIFLWVNGSEEASRCPVPANGWAILMDRNEDVFYIKRVDTYGNTYPLETYDFTRRPEPQTDSGISQADFASLQTAVAQIQEQMGTLMKELGGTTNE